LDPDNKRWSIRFATKEISDTFVTHLAYAIFSVGSRSKVYMIELQEGRGEEVRESDTVGTRWTGYVVNGLKIEEYKSNYSDKNPQRYTLGNGSVIEAWEIGTLGMKKGSRRVVVSPSHMTDGPEPPVPKDKDIIFVIEIERTKKGPGIVRSVPRSKIDLEEDAGSGSRGKVVQDLKRVARQDYSTDNNDWERGRNNTNNSLSLNPQPTYPMQPIQPTMPTVVPTLSGALVIHNPNMMNPTPFVNPMPAPYSVPPSPYFHPPPQPAPPPAHPVAPTNSLSLTSNDHIQLLVDERQYKQSINSKLDTVIAKVDQLTDRMSISLGRDSSEMHVANGISARALLQTIQRIVTDNDRLHQEVEDKTHLVEKMRSQVSDLMERNAKIVDENNIYIQERNTSYNEFTNTHKKKMAELEDTKESLQIEVSNAATELAKAGRRYENLKKQALNMQDEFNSTKEDLERERSLREKEKHELETVTAELNNIKQKYREDNRKMKETVHDRDDLQTQLNTAREQIERLNKIVEERTQQLSKDKATVELAYIQERNNLIEQLESINTELRNERISAARRIQESEESAAAQLKQHIEELRAKASKELERRTGIAVENALANATALSEESKQQALTAARIAFNEEKDRTSRILQENFNARLQEEIKLAYEKGRQVGMKDSGRTLNVNDGGALHQLKEMEFENLKQSYEREIANQKRLIASLSSNAPAPAPSKGFSLDEVSNLVKNIVNETFKSIREEFHPDQNYTGEHVTSSVRNILVTKTIGGIPKEEPRYSEPVVHVQNTDSEPVHRPVQSVPIHSPEAPKPTQSVPPPEQAPERSVPAAVEPEPESEPVITTQQRFVSATASSVPEPEPEPEPVITSEPALEKQTPPEPEESPDNTAPKSRFSAFHDADSDSDTDAMFTKTETQHSPQTPEPSTDVSHQHEESPSDTTDPEQIPVTTETKPEEVLTGKSQDKSEDKQDTDWDDDEEEPEKPEPQTATSQPAAVPSGPPPVKANAFSFLDDSDEDSDPFFASSKKKTADNHDPFDFGTKKKEDTTKSKTSNGTTSASTLSDPLDVPTTTKEKTTTKDKTASTGSDWMFGETPKNNPLGDIFGSSDKTKTPTTTTSTTSSTTTKKNAKSAFDDEEEDDFLGGFKDPLVSSKKTDAKDIWGDDDGSDLFG
jgi:FKBP-type peptidyl-prolyl cis-trans isomerase